jgi:hypothetical protein
MPPFFHWYVGDDPPLVGVAVKVTEVPAQIAPEGTAAMLTLAGSGGFTVMVISLDVAGLPETHVSLEVISTVILSPSATEAEVYVNPVSPGMLTPPFFHW